MRYLLPLLIIFAFLPPLRAQTFPCDGSFYLVMQIEGRSELRHLSMDESGKLRERPIPLSEPQRRYTCLGLSLEDLHLYALDFNTRELLRIDAEGQVTNLGVPENLDTSLEYWAGDASPEGRRLFVVGRDPKTGTDSYVFNINLTVDNHYAGSAGIVSYHPTKITDVATDPIRGIMYGYDKANRQIVAIGTSSIAHHNHQPISPILEAMFFDQQGRLYAYGSDGNEEEQSSLYAIDKLKGGATYLATGRTGSYSDGCSCAQTLQFTRTVTPNRVLPCTEVSIDYHITNHSGIGKTGIYFEDLLPDALTITEVVDHTFTLATIESGVGSNKLFIPNLDVLLGENIIRVRAFVEATPESLFSTQASLTNLPLGLGGQLLSDNPHTAIPYDPNLLEILQVEEFELEDYIQYNCSYDTAVLSVPFTAHTYRWSDGSQSPTLRLTKPGRYWVEAIGDCMAVSDTIDVADFPQALSLELGADQRVKEGTELQLSYNSNAVGSTRLQWSSSSDFDLNCIDCNNPGLTALQSQTYYLQLTDESGCTVSDSIRITVLPARAMYTPNAFSPNGDGINDVFYIQGEGTQGELMHFGVFNRWGVNVFEQRGGTINSAAHGWDGRYGSLPAPGGAYVWTATVAFPDGQVINMYGTVLLIRN